MPRPPRLAGLVLACLGVVLAAPAARAQGPTLSGAGPVSRSMGGASTAAPLDATGALYWNPASITGLRSSEINLGVEIFNPHATLSSSIPGGALGPGLPAGRVAGSTRDESGAFVLPSGGFVYKPEGSPWTFGVGVYPTSGFGVNYPGSSTNPILSPGAPNGFGLGPVSSSYQVVQVAPTAAYQLTEKLSVGFAPLIDLARLSLTPGLFAAPGDANGDGAFSYPAATGTRTAWGGGFQVGLYYAASDAWQFGAAVRSQQWFEPFRFNSADETGAARALRFRFESPLIVSLGTAYTGIDRLTVAADVRYLNFGGASGSRGTGFDARGAVLGLGWDDVFSLSLGVQYQLTDDLAVRAGYTYNTSLIPERNAAFNVAAPVNYQHQLAVGASYRLTPSCDLTFAYYHVFANPITGPYLTPAGAIPGAAVTTGASADSVLVSAIVRF